jgi:hypothetical protein
LQALLADSLTAVYALFVGVAVVATVIAAFLPGGPPHQVSDAFAPTEPEGSAATLEPATSGLADS